MTVQRMAVAMGVAASLFVLPGGPLVAAASAAPAAKAAPTVAASPTQHGVDADALGALNRMSAYLLTLQAFQVSGDTVREEVEDSGQKLQLLGSVTYKVKRPDGLSIDMTEDRQVRRYVYDGKSLTIFAPRMGHYATVSAPPTIRQLLSLASTKYNITLPLEDLFIWGSDKDWHRDLTSGYLVGYARVGGQDADQYAFQQSGIDWQIWIARGDRPLPLRVVITDTNDPERPQFESSLNWNTAPTFSAGDFTFTPPPGAAPITIEAASN